MPNIYHIKTRGWKIKYRIYFHDGTYKDKNRTSTKKTIAQTLYKDATELESRSRARSLSGDDLGFFVNQKFLTQTEAEQVIKNIVPIQYSWGELVKKYEQASLKAGCRPYTHSCNINRLTPIMEFLEAFEPTDITEDDIDTYLCKRKDIGIKPASRVKELAAIRRLLDPLKSNPARNVPTPTIDNARITRTFSPKEFQKILECVHEKKHLLFGHFEEVVMIYLYAGLRPSEIVTLDPEDINLTNNKIHIQSKEGYTPKTGWARTVEIHPNLRTYLKLLVKKSTGKHLIGNGEERVNTDSISRAIRKVFVDCKIKNATPYA
ncbi:MAG: hypothetical protein KAT46_03890, partial [Deltaproteobacteria bacterium]|nr:hypothetical protein [Deltaproteobacteria bacterium]